MKMKRNILILAAGLLFLAAGGCSKMLDTEPSNAVGEKVVYNNIDMIDALLMSTYSMLKNEEPGWMNQQAVNVILWSTAYGSDINADPNPTYGNGTPYKAAALYMAESWNPNEYAPRGLWKVHYKVIFNANVILENIDNVTGSQSRKDAIKGQALVMRARCYFNLVRMYQHTFKIAGDKPGVPLRITSSIEENVPRATVDQVYAQIQEDLQNAETLLENYNRPGLGFYNVDVARFLLANVNLTMNKWADAQSYANKVRTKYPLMTLAEYRDGFTTPNAEWILGYEQTEQDNSSNNLAAFYDYGQNNTIWPMYVYMPAKHFVDLMNGDPRAMFADNPARPGKYMSTKFYEKRNEIPYGAMIDMRNAEMFLVEAEAACRQGQTSVALQLLQELQRARGITQVTTASGQDELLSAILLERRKEMYGEGLDFFDISRLELPVVKSLANGNDIDLNLPVHTNKLIMMIPDEEVLNNSAIEQNPDPSIVPVFIK
jgi:hypothetical protein